jgi:mono/diheme cytochrome c family protein/uncharacterized membrane protein
MQRTPEILLFVGRLHPLAVHLPIGFLVLLVVLETLSCSRRFRGANASAGYILALLVPAAWASALFGWLLSNSGEYETRLLQLHRALGFATAFLCTWVAILHWCRWKRLYTVSLYLNAVVLGAAGHFGGSLTHGSDYLVRHAPKPIKAILGQRGASTANASADQGKGVFASTIQPILQKRCGACHNPEKHKGGISFDTLGALLRGGENGSVVIPGDAARSPLLQRLLLPVEHEDHMPPAGKPQPTAEEVALLRWWINAGAGANPTGSNGQLPAEVRHAIEHSAGNSKQP